jgi:dTDP-4-dehydrorhamnose 3,5-epimerase
MHLQLPPAAQDKLVRVSRGAIFDVAVDIRPDSPTFGHWAGVTLSAEEWNQLFVPKGFAHGFVALEDGTEVIYKVSAPYAPELERSIRFDDPAIGIEWPLDADALILSDKDRAAPMLAQLQPGA